MDSGDGADVALNRHMPTLRNLEASENFRTQMRGASATEDASLLAAQTLVEEKEA
jgi:hypothetical protein